MKQSEKRYHRSSQRDAIFELVKESPSHPTAEEIFARLKHRQPRLSLGTVYRNLHILADKGVIREIHFGSGRDRFDGCTEPHYHLVCKHCGQIEDLLMPVQEGLEREARRRAGGFTVVSHAVEFYGLCAVCDRARQTAGIQDGGSDRPISDAKLSSGQDGRALEAVSSPAQNLGGARISEPRTHPETAFVARSSERAKRQDRGRKGPEAALHRPPVTFSPEDTAGGPCSRSEPKEGFGMSSMVSACLDVHRTGRDTVEICVTRSRISREGSRATWRPGA